MDEILDDVPWYPTIEWLDQNKIDYVVGDEQAYENYAAIPFRPVRQAGRFISMPREEGTDYAQTRLKAANCTHFDSLIIIIQFLTL